MAANFGQQEARTRILSERDAVLAFRLHLETQHEQVTVSAADSSKVDSYTIPAHTHVNAVEIRCSPVSQRNLLDLVLLDSGLRAE